MDSRCLKNHLLKLKNFQEFFKRHDTLLMYVLKKGVQLSFCLIWTQNVASVIVTTKIEVLRKRAALVVKWIVTTRERQLDRLWREGLRPRALANLEGDSTQ